MADAVRGLDLYQMRPSQVLAFDGRGCGTVTLTGYRKTLESPFAVTFLAPFAKAPLLKIANNSGVYSKCESMGGPVTSLGLNSIGSSLPNSCAVSVIVDSLTATGFSGRLKIQSTTMSWNVPPENQGFRYHAVEWEEQT